MVRIEKLVDGAFMIACALLLVEGLSFVVLQSYALAVANAPFLKQLADGGTDYLSTTAAIVGILAFIESYLKHWKSTD